GGAMHRDESPGGVPRAGPPGDRSEHALELELGRRVASEVRRLELGEIVVSDAGDRAGPPGGDGETAVAARAATHGRAPRRGLREGRGRARGSASAGTRRR